jgi:hypothetical protein
MMRDLTNDAVATTTTGDIFSISNKVNKTVPLESLVGSDTEFREFLIWLCGFTDAVDAPDQLQWMKLQKKVKAITARYVLARREQMKRQAAAPVQLDLFDAAVDAAAKEPVPELVTGTIAASTGVTTTITPYKDLDLKKKTILDSLRSTY